MLREGLAGGIESGESSASEDTVKLLSEQAVRPFEHYELVKPKMGNRSSWVAARWGHLQSDRRRSALPRDAESHQRALSR